MLQTYTRPLPSLRASPRAYEAHPTCYISNTQTRLWSCSGIYDAGKAFGSRALQQDKAGTTCAAPRTLHSKQSSQPAFASAPVAPIIPQVDPSVTTAPCPASVREAFGHAGCPACRFNEISMSWHALLSSPPPTKPCPVDEGDDLGKLYRRSARAVRRRGIARSQALPFKHPGQHHALALRERRVLPVRRRITRGFCARCTGVSVARQQTYPQPSVTHTAKSEKTVSREPHDRCCGSCGVDNDDISVINPSHPPNSWVPRRPRDGRLHLMITNA